MDSTFLMKMLVSDGGKWRGYTEHKDSEVKWLGETSAHWTLGRTKIPETALDDRNSLVNGLLSSDLPTSEIYNSGGPVVNIRDIKANGYHSVSMACITPAKEVQLEFNCVDAGYALVTKVDDSPGVAAVGLKNDSPGINTQEYWNALIYVAVPVKIDVREVVKEGCIA